MKVTIDRKLGTDLPTMIRNRLREEAKDIKEMEKLKEENPRLFNLCVDIDNMISIWAIGELHRIVHEKEK